MLAYSKISNKEKYRRVGLNIALQRKLKNMSQLELAEKLGVSRTHISNIEAPNMDTNISLELIFNIADILEIPVSSIFNFA